MLRAAHYKGSEQQDTLSKGSPAKHRPGGILDLALTAADRYALSLLPNAVKGTGLSTDGTHQQPSPGEYQYRAHNHPVNGVSPALRQRGQGQQMLHTMPQPAGSPSAGQQPPQLDSRMVNSWDNSLKEILSALEPDGKSIKPTKLRDYRYPAQNHGTARALEEAMATIPGGRRGKAPMYGSPSKPSSRVARRAELQGVEVQYDVLPGVKLAWANTGTYTSGPSSSPKKYTSTLVGKTSPHYSSSRAATSGSPGQGLDAVHLPDIGANSPGRSPGYSSGQHHGYGHSSPHAQSGFRASPQAVPPHQAWAQHTTTTTVTPRKPLPYVSTTVPSLAKPLTVQYHPVLRSPTTPSGGTLGPEGSVGPQRPATDGAQGPDQLGFAPPHRVPYTPPEVAAELARLRHTQDLDGVITSIKYDLQAAAGVRPEPSKTKFLQMYEDPNRPLASLNPKQLLAELTPPKGKKEASRSVGGKSSEKPGRLVTGLSPSVSPSGGPLRRSPMYERRLKPITSVTGTSAAVPPARPSGGQLPAAAPEAEADSEQELMRNVHLHPPEVPGEGEQKGVAATDAATPARPEAAGPAAEAGEGAGGADEEGLSGDDGLGATGLETSGRATPVSTLCGEDELPAAALASAAEEAEAQVARGAGAAADLVSDQPAGEGASWAGDEAAAPGGDGGAVLAGDEAAGDVVVVHGGELLPPAEQPLVDEQPAAGAQAASQQQEATVAAEGKGPDVVPGEQQVLVEQTAGSGDELEGQMGSEPAGEELPPPSQPEPPPPEADQPEAAAAGEQAAEEAVGAQARADAPAAPEQADAALEEQERPASAAPEAPAAAAAVQAEAVPYAGTAVDGPEAGAQPAEPLAAELPAESADGEQPASLEAQPESESAETVAAGRQDERPASATAAVAAKEEPSPSGTLEEAPPKEAAAPGEPPAATSPEEAPEPSEPAPESVSAAEGEAEPDATQPPVEQEQAGAEEPQPASTEPEEQAGTTLQLQEEPPAAAPEPETQDAGTAAAAEPQEASGTGESAEGITEPATAETHAAPVAAEDEQAPVSLPLGVSPEVAEPAVVLIQTHMRGLLARKRVAQMRSEREAGQVALAAAAIAVAVEKEEQQQEEEAARQGVSLPPGVTPEAAAAAATRVQAHMRGHLARKRVALMRKQRRRAPAIDPAAYELPAGASEEQLVRVQAHMRGHLARRKVAVLKQRKAAREAYEPPAGASVEQVEAAAVRVQAHMRGYLARKHVASMRKRRLAALDAADAAGAEAEADAVVEAELEPEPELTVDALQAALAEDADESGSVDAGQEADVGPASDTQGQTEAVLDDPVALAAAAAAAAAKGAVLVLGDVAPGGDEEGQDVDPAADQAAEANMERMAATSARMSAMFQGAGAEMRYSDDEAGALDLMDNLDGLLDGNDDAAAVAAAVAAAATPAEGEIVSISPYGVSEPQALQPSLSGVDRSGSAAGSPSPGGPAARASPRPPNPKDTMEPGGVRVLNGKYEVQHVVGEGAYGMVMKCKVRGTEPVQWVAIKEFKIEDNDPDAEDVKRTSLREVAVLETLQHPHVVRFVDKFMVGDRLFIVMEFLPCNLLELLEAQPGGMDRDAVRLIMFQLCSAIAFIHSKSMVYRDIKPENLLVDERGTVKLCDFGFARRLPSGPSSHLTDYVATRWYRAPELLLGPPFRDATGKHVQYMYGPPVDLWAIGCLMGELLDGEPLFAGDSDLDQLYRVQQILGPMAPSHQYLFYANPHNTGIVFNIKQPLSLAARYQGKVSDVELDFLSGLLEMDPEKRMTGEQCLQHPYLADLTSAAQGMPSAPSSAASTTTPTPPSGHGRPSGGGDGGTPRASSSGVEAAAAALGSLTPSRNGSLQRTPGSLTRTPGSMTRAGGGGSFSGTPLRMGSLVRTEGDEQVVVIEGVVEGDEEGVAEAEAEQLAAVSAPVDIGEQDGEAEAN